MTKRWIITGANGYVGNEICRGLSLRGEIVIGLARSGRLLANLEKIGISCHTYNDLSAILAEEDILVHCAGKVAFNGVWDEFLRTNVDWTVALFDRAVEKGVSCFIYVSSVAALGYKNRPKDNIIDETTIPKISEGDMYGRSKWLAEQALKLRARNTSTRLIVLRPGLIYGRRPFSYSQTWLRRGFVIDLNQRLPLVHIDSLLEAILKAVEKPGAEGVFIVADNEQPTVRVLNALKKKLGILRYHPWHIGKLGFWLLHFIRFVVWHIRGQGSPVQKGYALAQYHLHSRRLVYSTDKLRSIAGWEPQINLVDGLAGCRDFCRKAKTRAEYIRMQNVRHIIEAVNNRFFLRARRGPIGIGLIGIGGWGATNAMNIMRTRRFNVIGVHDSRAEFAYNFARHFKTKNYPRIQDLMNNPSVQAVSITVPNQFHADMVKVAADAGKHIFIEKPLASTPDICRELGHYCHDRRIILQVGHQMRRDPIFRKIKRILEIGVLGRPLFIQGVYTLKRQYRNDWRGDAGACPGGSMEQLGVHLIDVLIYLFGFPLESNGWRMNIPFRSDAPDWASVSLSFNHNIHASISTSFSSPTHISLEFLFDQGYLATDGQKLWITTSDTKIKTERPRGVPGGVAQFMNFADCIEHGKEPETGAAEAAEVMNVVCSIFSGPEV